MIRPMTRMPGVIRRVDLVGVRGMPRSTRPAPVPRQPVATSPLWTWYRASHAARVLLCLPLPVETPDEAWPDWAYVGDLAIAATLYLDKEISRPQMGRFVRHVMPEIERRVDVVEKHTPSGLLLSRRWMTMYQVGPFRDRRLTDRPAMW